MSAQTMFSVLSATEAQYSSRIALHQPVPGGTGEAKYRTHTWGEYKRIVIEIACGLRVMGVQRGDIVGLDSETRAEFYLADLGIMSCGAVAAAVYTSYPEAEQMRTLRACEPKAIFVEDGRTLKALLGAGGSSLNATWILLTGEASGHETLESVREKGRSAIEADPKLFDRIHGEVSRDDYAILYLTSGATGEPKMGLVTHGALVDQCEMGPPILPLGPEDSTLAFLPSAHITQRVVMELLCIRMAIPVWFSEGLSKMPGELRTIRPTLFVAPPRVWERVYASICMEIKKKPAVIRKMFYAAIGLGSEAARYRERGEQVPGWLKLALKPFERLVFNKVRTRLGGRLKIPASGAAPLSKDLAAFYAAIGMPLIEGYGLTEGGVATMNPPDRPKSGSIGKALLNVRLRLDEDGELQINSPAMFSQYFKDPASTAAVFTNDGWLRTGDIAEIDAEGYVYITGRKKELIVSSNGKKIYPARIESLFKMEPLINQVILIGDRLPYVSALFTINPAAVDNSKPLTEAVASPGVQEQVKKAVQRANRQLASFEQIRKYRILERDFSIENGELTPTMKVRRKKVLENFRAQVAEMYAGREDSL
jgi:long-chain acyl-CoA synthetase